MKKLALFSAVLVGIVVAVFFWLEQQEGRKASAHEKTVRIMDPLEANNLHVPVAEKKGFFSEGGLRAEVSYTSAGKFAMDALNSRSVDYAIVVDMNVAQTLFEHQDVTILAEIAQPIQAIKLLGRRDHGVVHGSDLVGKRVGVLFGVNIHLFLLKYIEDHDIELADVDLVNLRPPDAVAAFERGDVDAVVTWQPHVYRLQESLGENITVLSDDSEKYWTYKMLAVTRQSTLEANRDEAKRVVEALLEADKYIEQNRDGAIELLAEHLGMEMEAVASFFSEIHFEVRLTQELTEMIEFELGWLSENFYDGKPPVTTDVDALMAGVLKEVSPERVHSGAP